MAKKVRKRTRKELKQSTLRDPDNPDEAEILAEIKQLSDRLFWAWIAGGPGWGLKEIAERARLHPVTVKNYVTGNTKRVSLATHVRLAFAVGYRSTLVKMNTKLGAHEALPSDDAIVKLRKELGL